MVLFKEKTKIVYFAIDPKFSEWLMTVSRKVGVTKEQMTRECIEDWVAGKLVIV